MKVVFVQTYPVYHDGLAVDQWLRVENRDRWMPALLAEMGHEVELWAVAEPVRTTTSHLEGFADYTIRIFPATSRRRATKFHFSDALVDHARRIEADLYILKGVDGGIGKRLLRRHLDTHGIPFVFVIGGKYYTRDVPRAEAVFYETREQAERLARPGFRIWRRPVEPQRMIRLPKSIDTDHFAPRPTADIEWDVISAGRVDERLKSFDTVGMLATELRVAVVGDGPSLPRLKVRYPKVDWLGWIPHERLPDLLTRSRVFVHEGRRDFFPRVIVEAASCGLPCVVRADAVAEDVLPRSIGVRAPEKEIVDSVRDLVADDALRVEMAERARDYAVERWGKRSSAAPLKEMLLRIGESRSGQPTGSGMSEPDMDRLHGMKP